MRKFMTLVDIEMNRIFKVFLPTLLLYIILGVGNSVIVANNTMTDLKNKATIAGKSLEQYLASPDYARHDVYSLLYNNKVIKFGFAILIFAVIIYSLVIWYREWFGNNKTIYTLLTIPFDRSKVYLAKFVTIAIMFLSTVSAFLITLIGFYIVNKSIIVKEAIEPFFLKDIIGFDGQFVEVFSNKLVISVAIIEVISLVFLFCILERSFRLKGLILGLILGITIFVGTIFILIQGNLYYIEKKWLIIGVHLTSAIAAIIYSNYLLKNKIAV